MIATRGFALIALWCASAAAAPPTVEAVPGTPVTAASPGSATPVLGRFFFTPAQREAIDHSRHSTTTVVEESKQKPLLPPAPAYVTLNGVVRRSDGVTTIWLNERELDGRRTAEGLEVSAPKRRPGSGNITLRVPQAGRTVDLRVGQQLEVNTGTIRERYQVTPPPESTGTANPAEGSMVSNGSASKPSARKPARERELLHELLREIDGPSAERPEAPAAAKG
jgi:hypothetical protein